MNMEEIIRYINNRFCGLSAALKKYVDQVTGSGGAASPFADVATKAAADALAATLTTPKIINVLADETQGGDPITYYFNGTTLQEILLL